MLSSFALTILLAVGIVAFYHNLRVTSNNGPVEDPLTTLAFTQELSEAELLEIATQVATGYGLASITSHQYMWIALGEWRAEQGAIFGPEDPDIPVLVVAYTGSGVWNGAGGGFEPPSITGLTVAMHSSGQPVGIRAGYNPPPYNSGRTYTQRLDYLTPNHPDIDWAFTPEATSEVLPVPPPPMGN